MPSDKNLEPMFLNPVDAALHATIELRHFKSDKRVNWDRLESILAALTDKKSRASGSVYGMMPLSSQSTYVHVAAIEQALIEIEKLFKKNCRNIKEISIPDANRLEEFCSQIHEHYQAAKWIEERKSVMG